MSRMANSAQRLVILSCSVVLLLLSFTPCHQTQFSSSSFASSASSSSAAVIGNSGSRDRDADSSHPLSSQCDHASEEPLGMESKDIPDSAISASSSYNELSVGPLFSRLNSDVSGGAWCPQPQLDSLVSGSEWIAVNLTKRFTITGIATQGRFGNGMGVEYAEEYWIEYSRDGGATWLRWKNRKGDFMIRGNSDTYSIRRVRLEPSIVGVNMVRIVPYSEHLRTICLRFELFGCSFRDPVDEEGDSVVTDDLTLGGGAASDGSSSSGGRASRGEAHRVFIFAGSGLLALTVGILVVVSMIKLWMRVVRRKKQPNFYSSVDVDFMTGGGMLHHQVPYPGTTTLISGGTATPVYCDPDQYVTDYRHLANHQQQQRSNTVISMMPSRVTKIIDSSSLGSSNVSNSMDRYGRLPPGDQQQQQQFAHHQVLHHQRQQQQEQEQLMHRSDSGLTDRMISDHEYAVPDVIYKESEATSRLICNPLQEAVENLKNNTHKGGSGGSIASSLGSSTSGRRTTQHSRQQLQPLFSSPSRPSRFDV